MRVAFFFKNQRGVSTPRLAVIASGLALASLIGVRVLEAPLASRNQVAIAAENRPTWNGSPAQFRLRRHA
jgi:hypothetical protein